MSFLDLFACDFVQILKITLLFSKYDKQTKYEGTVSIRFKVKPGPGVS